MEVNLLTTLFCLFQVVETSNEVSIILFLHKYIIIIFSFISHLISPEIKSLSPCMNNLSYIERCVEQY